MSEENVTAPVIAQLRTIRSQIDSLILLLTEGDPLPPAERTAARVPAKGNQCPHCGVSNPKRETAGGFGYGEEKTYCGTCGKEL